MKILGIETSCDETAAAVVDDTRDGADAILGEVVRSQIDDHAPFGGIVPEIAARAHLETIDAIVAETMRQAETGFDELDAVAATGGPGLIGGVIVGVMTAKAIAAARGIPFIAVNHLEAHALTARLIATAEAPLDFPYLVLLVSGGHTQLLVAEGVGRYRRLGTTIDDAVGEAFDKTAKLLGLDYPGGPMVERLARGGDARRFALPRPMKGRAGCDFSFSGLKTAVRHALEALLAETNLPAPDRQAIADLCASFQQAAADALIDRTRNAVEIFRSSCAPEIAGQRDGRGALVVSGGVAANGALREALERLCADTGMRLVAPPQKLCTDNGAMIAWAGIERMRLGLTDSLDFAPRPRWPLDPDAPERAFAGAKA